MKGLPVILCLTICASYRTLPAEQEPFHLQLSGQDKVRLDLTPLVGTFYRQQEASQSIAKQRPRGEILKPPVEIASKLSAIDIGMNRSQVEQTLGGWTEIGGVHCNSGYLAEYVNRAYPNLMIQVWYGWVERRFEEGRLIRKSGPNAPILRLPAVLETKLPLPDAK